MSTKPAEDAAAAAATQEYLASQLHLAAPADLQLQQSAAAPAGRGQRVAAGANAAAAAPGRPAAAAAAGGAAASQRLGAGEHPDVALFRWQQISALLAGLVEGARPHSALEVVATNARDAGFQLRKRCGGSRSPLFCWQMLESLAPLLSVANPL